MNTNVSFARYANIALGVWLFISAFIWTHSASQHTNTWIVGVLSAVIAAVAIKVQEARYLNSVLAIWLFISVWALPTISSGTAWNNALVAIAMFALSLVPNVARAHLGPTGVTRR